MSATKEILRRFVKLHFPVARNVKVADADALAATTADSTSRLAKDAAAASPPQERAVTVPECVRMRDGLLAEIEALELPPHFLDGALPPRPRSTAVPRAQVSPRADHLRLVMFRVRRDTSCANCVQIWWTSWAARTRLQR